MAEEKNVKRGNEVEVDIIHRRLGIYGKSPNILVIIFG